MTAGQAIRWSTIAAVSLVALVAAFVSYRHALQVVRLHGESGPLAKAYPLTIDGLIYAASMVLLDAARRGIRPHPLAYLALGLGIAATVAANVAAGIASGPPGAIVAAWPALALVISYELLMLLLRSSGAPAAGTDLTGDLADLAGQLAGALRGLAAELRTGLDVPGPVPHPDPVPGRVPEPPAGLNGHGHQAAELFAAELQAGQVPGIRAIRAGLHVGQDKAQQVQAYLAGLPRT